MKFIEVSATAFWQTKPLKRVACKSNLQQCRLWVSCIISPAMWIVETLDKSNVNTILTSLTELVTHFVPENIHNGLILLDLIVLIKKQCLYRRILF